VVGGWWLVVGGGDGDGDGCEQVVLPDQIDDGLDRERDGGYISVALLSTHPTSSGNVTPHTQVKCMTQERAEQEGSQAVRACMGVSSSACVHEGDKLYVRACVRRAQLTDVVDEPRRVPCACRCSVCEHQRRRRRRCVEHSLASREGQGGYTGGVGESVLGLCQQVTGADVV
jgi:hypothetical protein